MDSGFVFFWMKSRGKRALKRIRASLYWEALILQDKLKQDDLRYVVNIDRHGGKGSRRTLRPPYQNAPRKFWASHPQMGTRKTADQRPDCRVWAQRSHVLQAPSGVSLRKEKIRRYQNVYVLIAPQLTELYHNFGKIYPHFAINQ
jgi:hypothetical protein